MASQNNPLPNWITRGERDDNLQQAFYVLMKELHLSYDDIMGMPVPAIFSLLRIHAKHVKDEQRELKRARKK